MIVTRMRNGNRRASNKSDLPTQMLKARLGSIASRMQEVLDRASGRMTQLEATEQQLKGAVETYQRRLSEVSKECRRLEMSEQKLLSDISAATDALNEARSAVKSKSDEIRRLRLLERDTATSSEEQARELESLRRKVTYRDRALESVRGQVADLIQQVAARDAEIRALRQSAALVLPQEGEVTGNSVEEGEKNASEADPVHSLEAHVQLLGAQLVELEEANVVLERQNEKLKDDLSILRGERDQNLKSHSDLRRQLSDAQIEIRRLKAGTSDEVWNLKKKVEDAEKKVQEREFEFRNLQLRIGRLEDAELLSKQQNEKLKSELSILYEQRQRMERAAHQADAEIERLKKAMEKSSRSVPAFSIEQSFDDPTVLRWLISAGEPEIAEVPNGWIATLGEGPWNEAEFCDALDDLGYERYQVPDPDLTHLIVGRKGWSEQELLAQIDESDGRPLRIYSQEMFVAKLMTGRDPFDADDEDLLLSFAEGHPALEFLQTLAVSWPSLCEGEETEISLVDRDEHGVAESPLHQLGYQVGLTSQLTEAQRRRILTKCFEVENLQFTDGSSEEYRRKWGRGSTAQRLYRIATHIRWLAEVQGRDHRKYQARADWLSDLEWLRVNYHHRMRRRFTWP